MHHQHGGAAGGGNRYQTNWQYGYTLGPPSESTNGNYQFYNSRRQQQQQHQQGQQQQQYQNYHGGAGAAYATGGTQAKSNNIHINAGSSSSGYGDWSAPAGGQQYSRPSGYGSGGRTQAHQEPKSWAQIKPKPDPSTYISKVFVTASSSSTTNTSPTETAGGSSSLIGPKKPTGENGEDLGGPGCTACSQLHSLAVFNQLVEKYDSVVEPGAGFLVTLTLGNETYSGRGSSIGAGKQNAAMQALSQTQYKNRQTMKPRPQGITPTSELHELATKKAVTLDFVFLEPYLFNIKAVKGWSKNEARGQYKVQLTVGGETPLEFIGEGEFPQQAKHNAAIKAIPAVRSLPDAKATAKVVSAPPAVATVAATEGAAAESNPSGFKVENVKNVVMLINEIAVSHGLAIEWEMLSANGPPHMKSYTCQLKVGTHECVGNGNSKKNAKAQAALNMMTVLPEELRVPKAKKGKKRKGAKNKEEDAEKQVRLDNVAGQEAAPAAAASGAAAEENKVDNTSSAVPTVVQPTKTNSIVGQPVYKIIQSSSPISAIHEYCKKAKIPEPLFECISENVLDTWQKDNRTFKKTEYTMRLLVEGQTYFATGNKKKDAKNQVATDAWNVIRASKFM